MTDGVEQSNESVSDTGTSRGFLTTTVLVGWQAGVVAGLAGAAVMGILVSLMNPVVLRRAIPAMYGLSGGVVGWAVHLSHGAVIGVGFAAALQSLPFDRPGAGAKLGFGLVWGVAMWVGLAALVMPVWLSVVGAPMPPMVPNFAVPSLLWHLVYGGVLGAVYQILR